MIETFKLLFTDPKQFFKQLKSPSYSTVLKFLFYVIFIPYLLNYYFSAGLEEGFGGFLFATSIIVALLTILIGPFFSAALSHIGVKLFKGSGYKKTFYASAHAMAVNAPYVLAQAVLLGFAALSGTGTLVLTILGTIISFFGLVHVIITEIYGLKQLHGLSTGQAVVSSVVIPIAIIFLILIIIVGLTIFMFAGLTNFGI